MTIKVDATVRNGRLETAEPVPIAEGTPVRVEITPVDDDYDPLDGVIGICDGEGPTDLAENHDKYLYGDRPS